MDYEMDQKPASRSRGRKNEEEPTTTTTTRNTNKNNNEVEEDALTKAPSFVRIDAADEEMRAAKRSARHVSSNSRRGPSAFTAAGAVSVPPPSSRLLSLAPAVHGEEDVVQHDKKKEKAAIEEGDAERNSKDIERAIRDHNDGTPSAVGAVKMNGQEQGGPASVAELLAKSKEGEKSSSFVLHDHDHAPEAFSVVAELATDTDELEKERDELRRQLSMERRQKSDVIVASAVVRLASTNNLNPNEYSSGDITDEETKNNKNKKFLLYGLVCLLVVGAAVAAGVVVGGLGGDPTNLARPLSPEEELFFPSAGLPIDGEEQYALFGQDTSINQDGTRLVVADTVGAHLYSLQDDGTGQSDWFKNGDTIVPDNCGELVDDDDEVSVAIRSNVVVDLSRNGKYVAIGCPFAYYADNTTGTIVEGAGKVELYQEVDDGSWDIVGTPIYGSVANAHFGASVSLSGNGGQLAIGTPGSNGGVTVWAINQGEWIQFGDTIEAETLLLSVSTVSLSSDGSILAMSGIPLPGGDAVVEIYGLVLGAWAQMGDGIEGQLQDTSYICDLSGNGQVVAVSNYYVGDGVGPAQGALNDALDVRAFEWSESQQAWMLMGENLHASAPGQKSGYFISLSDDGKLMGMGDPGRRTESGDITGHAHVYYYDGSEWIQLGPNEYGEGAGDQFGFSIALSSSGNSLLVSAPFSRGKGYEHGRVVVYDIDVDLFLTE